jgi:hypothetical protein
MVSKFSSFITAIIDTELFFVETTIRELNSNDRIEYYLESKDDNYINLVCKLQDIYTILTLIVHWSLSSEKNIEILDGIFADLVNISKKLNLKANPSYKKILSELPKGKRLFEDNNDDTNK